MKVNQKEEKESTGKKLYCGFEKLQLIAVNPTNEERAEIFGFENDPDKQEIEYLGQDKEGNPQIRISCIFKGEYSGATIEKSFFISQKEKVSQKGLYQYVNQHGDFQYVETEDQLFDSFVNFTNVKSWNTESGKYSAGAKPAEVETLGKKLFRKAFEGESQFMGWFKMVCPTFNPKDMDDSLLLDPKKIFKGNLSQIETRLNEGDHRKDAVCMLTVRTTSEEKQYQDVYTQTCLPGTFFKSIKNGMKMHPQYEKSRFDKYLKDLEAGCNQFWVVELVREYDPAEDGATSKGAIVNDFGSQVETPRI